MTYVSGAIASVRTFTFASSNVLPASDSVNVSDVKVASPVNGTLSSNFNFLQFLFIEL